MSYGMFGRNRAGLKRLTVNQSKRQNVRYVELLAGHAIPELREGVPVAPAPRRAADPNDSEGPVIKAVAELLSMHPLVLFAERRNSGALPYINAEGKSVPVRFHRVLTGQPVRVVDFTGWLKDGRPFALEAKRPSWKKPGDEREIEQANYLMLVRNLGGLGGFVRSVEEAKRIIENAHEAI